MDTNRKCLDCGAILRTSQKNDICDPCLEKKREEDIQKSVSIETIRENTGQDKISRDELKGKLLTVKEAAKLLRYSERTVRDKIKEGKITAFRLPEGRRILIPAEEIDRLLGLFIGETRRFPDIEIKEDLPYSFSLLHTAIEILKSPKKTHRDIEQAAGMLEKIPFREDTARLYEILLSKNSMMLSHDEKSEVLEGFRIIFNVNRNREDVLSVHVRQRSAHWMARSGEEEFAMTVKRLYQNEKIAPIKRGMMMGLILSKQMDANEYLDTFLDKESNQLLDILICQMRSKDIPHSLKLLLKKDIKIGQNFENSLQSLLFETNNIQRYPLRFCSLRTINNILAFGKEYAVRDFKKVLSRSTAWRILHEFISKEGFDSTWKVEIDKLKQFVKENKLEI